MKFMLLVIKRHSNNFDKMIQKSHENIRCSNIKCKYETINFIRKKQEYINNILKLTVNMKYNNHLKKINKLKYNFQNNRIYKIYNTLLFNREHITDKINKQYKNLCKQYTKNLIKLIKNYKNSSDYKNYKKNIDKLTKEYINSNETKTMAKCSFNKCKKIHKDGIKLVKNFAKDLCKNKQNKKYCKIYNYINKINLNKLTFKQNKNIIKLIKNI